MWKRKLACVLSLCICVTCMMTACQQENDPGNDPSDTGNDSQTTETSVYPNLYVDETPVTVNAAGITWEEGQALPAFAPHADTVYALNVAGASDSKMIMLATFCGVVNKTQPRVMLYTSDEQSEKWYEKTGINLEVVKDTDSIITQYKDEIKGLIVWDESQEATMHLAATQAGIENALVVNKKQMETYSAEPYNFPVIADYRGKFSSSLEVFQYLYDNFWEKCSHRLLAGPKLKTWQMLDLVVGANLAAVWFDVRDEQESALLGKFLADMTPGESYYIGWWSAEGTGVSFASNYGVPTVPADYYANYTIHASASRELDPPTVPAKPQLDNKIYIAFVMSEGDNMQYVQHTMQNSSLWGAKKRGTVPITWTCSSSLIDAGPQILNYFYTTATDNDCIVSGPSGLGYTDPADWDTETAGNEALTQYAQRTANYFWRSGFRMITVWNYIKNDQTAIYAKNIRPLVGISVQSLTIEQEDMQFLANGTLPVMATLPRYEKSIDQALSVIKSYVNANWDGSKPCFVLSQLVSWNLGVNDIIKLSQNLTKEYGDSVEFVRGDHLMMLYSEANHAPYNLILQSGAVTASSSDTDCEVSKAVDGSFAKGKGWQCSADEKWLQVDLGDTYTISRYILKNAGLAYASADLNTKGFKLQASTDGETWTDIDVVTANASNVVDKDVNAFTARYVKVEITDAGADGVARIQEFELYGVKG